MSQHILTLTPTDVLFFKDGRPMEGSSSGNGAAWPMPNVLSSAIHHALRRGQDEAGLAALHKHTPKRSGRQFSEDREAHGREFGSLQNVGPFPVDSLGRWFFPRPADAGLRRSVQSTLLPIAAAIPGSSSSLGVKLLPVVNTGAPSKQKPEPWLSREAYDAYLGRASSPDATHFLKDGELYNAEHNIGIGINPDTDTQDGERFYSASYLRLRDKVHLGLICQCMDKGCGGNAAEIDLIRDTFPNSGAATHILAGGQQRTCTVKRDSSGILPLPSGPSITGTRVKWTLLTPAIFPELKKSDKNPTAHPGGWLPSWIHPHTLEVQLKDPAASARGNEGRTAWRKRVAGLPAIPATLVAAIIPRSIPVTGWALHDTDHDTGALDRPGGARATHLAVPAGAVYYFECADESAAIALAAALNWHGSDTEPKAICNRRSTLMGEKGFGLGVCSSWSHHAGHRA